MLEDYLNQTCTLMRRRDTDPRGQPVFDEPQTVPCRLEEKFQLIRKGNGETIPTQHICYLTEAVAAGDSINGLEVHSAEVWKDLEGEDIGYKAVM